MLCSKCETENEDNYIFCKNCGEKSINGSAVNNLENQPKESIVKRVKQLSIFRKILVIMGILAGLFLMLVVFSDDPSTKTTTAPPSNPVVKDIKAPTNNNKNIPKLANTAVIKDDAQVNTVQLKEPEPPKQTVEQKKNGFYKVNYDNGDYYEGNFVDGKRQGQGLYIYASGAIYQGQWKEGNITGEGTFNYSDGGVYQGFLENGKRDGKGILQYNSGAYYEGSFSAGKRHGYGDMYYTNGNVYQGKWANDLREDNNGKLAYINGVVHVGIFTKDKMTGYGERTYTDGNYSGDFVDGKREGTGVFLWNSGNGYRGGWKNDKQHGSGEYYDASKQQTFPGVWENGKRISNG